MVIPELRSRVVRGVVRGYERLNGARARQRVGWTMIGVAIVGLVVSVAGTIIAWRLVGSVNQATGDTLDVTIDALDSTEKTLDVVDGTVTSTSTALTDLTNTLDELSASLDSGGNVVDDAGDLTETAGPAMADATVTFRQLEGLGSDIDVLLGGLSNLPLAPGFDPETGLGTTFGQLADDLEPLSTEFTTTAESLDTFSGSMTSLKTDVDELSGSITDLDRELAASEPLLDQYRANISEARTVAENTRDDLNRDQSLLRLMLVVVGVNFALAQLVPLWLGARLVASQDGSSQSSVSSVPSSTSSSTVSVRSSTPSSI